MEYRIIVDPDRLRQAAQRFETEAEEIRNATRQVRLKWRGVDYEARLRSGIDGRVHAAIQTGEGVAVGAETMARLLRRAANAFEQADELAVDSLEVIFSLARKIESELAEVRWDDVAVAATEAGGSAVDVLGVMGVVSTLTGLVVGVPLAVAKNYVLEPDDTTYDTIETIVDVGSTLAFGAALTALITPAVGAAIIGGGSAIASSLGFAGAAAAIGGLGAATVATGGVALLLVGAIVVFNYWEIEQLGGKTLRDATVDGLYGAANWTGDAITDGYATTCNAAQSIPRAIEALYPRVFPIPRIPPALSAIDRIVSPIVDSITEAAAGVGQLFGFASA